MQNKDTNEESDDLNLKLESSHPQNIWNDDIDDNIGDTCPFIPITNKLNTEIFYLKMISSFNHAIYSIIKHKILKVMVSQYHQIL
jgi:hypothetical protein